MSTASPPEPIPSEESTDTIDPAGSDQATRNALPPTAQRRRLDEALAGPQMSQQIALQTLRDEEAETARTMIRVGRLVGTVVLLPLPFIGGSDALRVAVTAGVALAIVFGLIVEQRIRTPGRFNEMTIAMFALSVSPAIFAATLYFGIYSAVQLFPALALYFFSRRESLRWALVLYVINAVTQAVFAGLMIFGAIDDPGLITPSLTVPVLIVGHVLLQVGFLGAFLLGRGSHHASREAIAKMQVAMRAAAQKEALLLEARQDLDRALGIASAGRFTDQVFGSYRLGHVIGRGGMGEVYEAFHVDSGEPAAVKLLSQRELGNPASVERFLREVRAVRGLTSPHVVRVLGASDEQDPIPFLVMERLRGDNLAHHLRSGRMSPEALLEMLKQVGAAIEEAWAGGIVHRDLKPQNLFLADGTGPGWKVLDFGVAALDDHAGTLTQGKIVGTPAYMAPEQARGERVDHRADVYALAAIAYRWLTGRPASTGKDLHAALYQTVHVMPQRPSALAELHPDVDAVLALGLTKEVGERWDSVHALRDALALALRGELDAATRRRAADALGRHPWGAVRG